MARTKAEIRAFLDSKVGTIVPHPGYPSLNGQCVTLTKALMEFLGVPNPYAARGDAINAGDNYLAQGLGTSGKGWLTIVVNRDMGYIGGVHYGHIWIDLSGEANYESNGARALYTTKNTRPISQGQQFVNFDKWVKDGGAMEIFNEGDRVNFNYWTYGSDKGFHKAQVGKEFKKAIYEIKDSDDYRRWQYLNSGDFFNHVGRQPNDAEIKQYGINPATGIGNVTHKSAWYTLQDEKKVGPVQPTPPTPTPPANNVPPGTYVKIDPANVIEVKG